MVQWLIQYHPKVLEDIEKNVALKDKALILETLERRLSAEPEKMGKPLGNVLGGYRRIRISKYRIVYELKRHTLTVYVVMIDRREDVYHEVLKRLGLF